MATNDGQSSTRLSAYGRPLRPSDVLQLNDDSLGYIDSVKQHQEAGTQPDQSLNRSEPVPEHDETPKSNEDVLAKYVIPQKRGVQLKSVETAPPQPSQHFQDRSYSAPKPRSKREMVVGGLSKDDELRTIWAEFDRAEKSERVGLCTLGNETMPSRNDVLGAWEEEDMLHDLNQEEGDW